MTARRATSARAGTPRRMTSESLGWRRTEPHSPLGQRAGLVEDAVGDAELADVVQQRRAAQKAAGGAVEPERRGDAVGDLCHAGAVARGVGRLGVDDARERLGDAIHPVGVGALDAVGGLDALHVGRCEAGPERAVALEHADGIDERGVVPGAAPGAGDVDRGRGPALLPEDLHRLRQARDAGQQRDLLAGPVARMALSVPMLEQLADRGGGLLVEADPARDVGAALAAHPLEL